MKKMNKKGFTLIEMLVVIAIIAILVSIVVPAVSNSTIKAKAATDAANLRSVLSEINIAHLSSDKTAAVTAGNFTITYENGDVKTITTNANTPKSEALTGTVNMTIYYDQDTNSFDVAFNGYSIDDMSGVANSGTLPEAGTFNATGFEVTSTVAQ